MEEAERTTFCGIEVPAEERTPLVDRLLRLMEQQQAETQGLRDEVARLKGLPPRPTIRPSTLNEPHPDPTHKKRRRGKRPGSAKRQKTGALIVHETIPLPLEGLPEGTRRIHEKRDDLLLVLERPEIPPHNNLSENDIREWAKKRKISAGTRSELGRRCRDTFISLKKTCRKPGVSFRQYLQDRIRGLHDILSYWLSP